MVPIKIRSTLSFFPIYGYLPEWWYYKPLLFTASFDGFLSSQMWLFFCFSFEVYRNESGKKISSRNFSCFQNPTFTLRHGELSSSLIGKHRSKFIKGIILYKKLDQYSFIRATVTVCHLNIFYLCSESEIIYEIF